MTVTFMAADTRLGGIEQSPCRAPGQPDVLCTVNWLVVEAARSVNTELIEIDGQQIAVTLVTASVLPKRAGGAHLDITLQIASLCGDMATSYRTGFTPALDNIALILNGG